MQNATTSVIVSDKEVKSMKNNIYVHAKQVGERIKERRNELGLSMSQFGERMGVNKSTIQRYEAKGIDPKKNYLIISLADALDTNAAWLRGESDDRSGDVISKCKMQIDGATNIFLDILEQSDLDESHQLMMTSILSCFTSMFGITTKHFDIAMREVVRIENDEGLKTSLMKYALDSGDISEKAYRQEMEQPVDSYRQMVDCLLHIFDNDGKNYIEELFEIRNTARQRLADKADTVAL